MSILDVSILDVSILDVSILDVSILDVSILDVSILDVCADPSAVWLPALSSFALACAVSAAVGRGHPPSAPHFTLSGVPHSVPGHQ